MARRATAKASIGKKGWASAPPAEIISAKNMAAISDHGSSNMHAHLCAWNAHIRARDLVTERLRRSPLFLTLPGRVTPLPSAPSPSSTHAHARHLFTAALASAASFCALRRAQHRAFISCNARMKRQSAAWRPSVRLNAYVHANGWGRRAWWAAKMIDVVRAWRDRRRGHMDGEERRRASLLTSRSGLLYACASLLPLWRPASLRGVPALHYRLPWPNACRLTCHLAQAKVALSIMETTSVGEWTVNAPLAAGSMAVMVCYVCSVYVADERDLQLDGTTNTASGDAASEAHVNKRKKSYSRYDLYATSQALRDLFRSHNFWLPW